MRRVLVPCRLQVFFDRGLCPSVCIEHVLGDGLDSIGGREDRVRFSFELWIRVLVMVGLVLASNGRHGEL